MAYEAIHLNKTFDGGKKIAARDVSVKVARGDFVAVVGESGSGKSTLARMMLHLLTPDSGEVRFNGVPLSEMDKPTLKAFRAKVQAVFQDPSGALNPRKRIRTILGEVTRFYGIASADAAVNARSEELLELVGLTPASHFMNRFPHELSGGQRQRILIAKSMIPQPDIIIADEAVSALDVAVKAGILKLMEQLRSKKGVGYLLISHDLPIVRKVASYVYVMRQGEVVEHGRTETIFTNPQHDYTKLLLGSALDLDAVLRARSEAATG